MDTGEAEVFRTRTATAATVIVAAALLAACGGNPSPTASGLTETTLPTASAAPTDTPAPTPGEDVFTHRDPGMTDAEALARMANPRTGERWFGEPRAIAAPEWLPAGDYYRSADVHWFELGTRGDRTIVGFADPNVSELFERSSDGSWEWIGSPSAKEEVLGGSGATFGYPDVPLNEHIYYDSITLPASFDFPGGGTLAVPEHDRGGPANPGYTVVSQPNGTTIDSIGGYDIRRYTQPVSFVWSEYYGVTAPPGVTYTDVYYMLATPYGMYIPLYWYPFGGLGDVDWNVPTTFQNDEFSYIADLNDIACGAWERDHNTRVTGIAGSQWTAAGASADGVPVYEPKAANPLVEPLYEAYAAKTEQYSEPTVSIGEFVAAPGFVAYQDPGSGEWFVYLNGTYSARAWC